MRAYTNTRKQTHTHTRTDRESERETETLKLNLKDTKQRERVLRQQEEMRNESKTKWNEIHRNVAEQKRNGTEENAT